MQKRIARWRAHWSCRASLLAYALVVVGTACITSLNSIPLQPYHRTAAVADAEPIGAEECETCHEEIQGHPLATTYHSDCESCHGPGSLHADSEDTAQIRFPASKDCLTCHGSGRQTHLDWSTSGHQRAGVMCSDCHNPHNREMFHIRMAREARGVTLGALQDASTLCVSCHPAVASRLTLPSHHPVGEGMLSCTDCHAPHGDRRVALGNRTQLCAGCHQDHVGPWIWEHAPVSEDCTLCHNPHGAASYNLLDTSQPALCLSCHTWPDEAHLSATGEGLGTGDPISPLAGAAFFTRCTDCHNAIHGSYEEPFLFR